MENKIKVFKKADELWQKSKEYSGEASISFMYNAFGMIEALAILENKDVQVLRKEWYEWQNAHRGG